MLVVALSLGSLGWSQSVSAATADQTAAIDFAQKAVQWALDYDQGKRESSMMDAQDEFAPEGWREFMTWLDGYIDDKGARLFSLTLTSSTMSLPTASCF